MNAKKTGDITAVVLLHGIGEQRPMTTLRSFVSGVFGQEGRSKPDRLSNLFEVRRLTLKDSKVHCYELYWAHHMTSSTMKHIVKWLLRLSSVPGEELRKMAKDLKKNKERENFYTTIRSVALVLIPLLAVIVIGLSYALNKYEFIKTGPASFFISVLFAAISLVWWWVNDQMVEVVGDAARYLDSTPANVGVRQAIRADCVRFLEKLNQNGEYSRIVIIGHSLGSVIAYDALRMMWAQLNPHMTLQNTMTTDEEFARLNRGGSGKGRQETLPPQRALFEQILPSKKRRWIISDLVTVGSPLAHAPLLFAEKFNDFLRLKKQRELPTCPPEDNWVEKTDQGVKLHHAAVFAVVVWTNFYFPSDPIGGPLSPLFGSGIHDVELDDAQDNSWINHVRYWDGGPTSGSKQFKQGILRLLGDSQATTRLNKEATNQFLASS